MGGVQWGPKLPHYRVQGGPTADQRPHVDATKPRAARLAWHGTWAGPSCDPTEGKATIERRGKTLKMVGEGRDFASRSRTISTLSRFYYKNLP